MPNIKDNRFYFPKPRINHFYKIIDKNAKLKVFKQNEVQSLLYDIQHPRRIILKARQMGITTDACVRMFDKTLFRKNHKSVVIAHEWESLKEIFRKIKIMYEQLPKGLLEFLNLKADTKNANQISFNNGSSIKVALSSRSETVHHLHISEFGKICAKYPLKAQEIITGAFESVPENGIIDIESTAEGDSGAFYEMFCEAVEKKPETNFEFQAVFFPWQIFDDYTLEGEYDLPDSMIKYQEENNLTKEQINWYYFKQKLLKDDIRKEYPSNWVEAFESPVDIFFNYETVSERLRNVPEQKMQDGWLRFGEYQDNHFYSVGIDVAEGYGGDSSVIQIVDITDGKQVAEFESNRITPDALAGIIKNEIDKIKNCIVIPERNSIGTALIISLQNLGVLNLYREKTIDKITNRPIQKFGWHTTAVSKPKMLFDFKRDFEDGVIEINSAKLLKEMKSFGGEDLSNFKYDDTSNHFDRVMAFAIAWQLKGHKNINSIVV